MAAAAVLGICATLALGAWQLSRGNQKLELGTNQDDATITQTIISMGRSLGLTVIAEGVETRAQLAFLQRHDCDQVQGYLFARPVPIAECAALIADQSRIAEIIDSVVAAQPADSPNRIR